MLKREKMEIRLWDVRTQNRISGLNFDDIDTVCATCLVQKNELEFYWGHMRVLLCV